MIRYLLHRVQLLPSDIPTILISEYAEANRVLPASTPFPGPWSNKRTPYLTEPMDNMSVTSPVQRSIVMKGAQLGFTAAMENVIVYWIDVVPSEILFISATEQMLQNWAVKRLDPALDSCGAREKIFAQGESVGSKRRTGDKALVKEFVGGTLNMASAQAAASLRADSKRVLCRDELDGAPPQLRTGEGNWVDVSYVRTNAWNDRRKVFDVSTPTIAGESIIEREYERGDKRKFLVPCPHCGAFQELREGTDGTQHGLKADTEAGRLVTVYYACEHCREPIYNHHKNYMLPNGYWEPTAISESKVLRSYHISSLYSPVGMLSWEEYYHAWKRAIDSGSPDDMRSFANLYRGKPFRDSGARPKLENVIELRGGYREGTVPDGVLFLTCAVDVQRGSGRNKKNPPRLEFEVCGHGAAFRTWSILYRRFEGEVADPFSGAWADFREFVQEGGLSFERSSDKRVFDVPIIFVDSGDGATTGVVYRFTSGWRGAYPSKGFSALRKTKKGVGDEMNLFNARRYRVAKVGEGITLYEISTNFYKNHIYNNLKITRDTELDEQKPGFCDFPVEYGEEYFKMLTAEEKRGDGSFHNVGQRRNEALDCRVMNLCACDVYLDAWIANLREVAKKKGANALQLKEINHQFVLNLLKENTKKLNINQ